MPQVWILCISDWSQTDPHCDQWSALELSARSQVSCPLDRCALPVPLPPMPVQVPVPEFHQMSIPTDWMQHLEQFGCVYAAEKICNYSIHRVSEDMGFML